MLVIRNVQKVALCSTIKPQYADAIAEYERQRASAREERRTERRQYREHMREREADRAAIAARENRAHSSKAENFTQLHSMPALPGEQDNSSFALEGQCPKDHLWGEGLLIDALLPYAML